MLTEAIQHHPRLCVLLVATQTAATARVAAELRARGMLVVTCSDAASAVRSMHEHGAELVLLAIPLGDTDWISAAAALKGGMAPPALLILDGIGQASELERVLPADRAPDAVLPHSAGTAELLYAIDEVLGPMGAAGPCLPEILVALGARRDSGVLEVRGGGVCTRISICDGAPTYAEGGSLRETLGRMLLRGGVLTETQYVRVIERMTERLIENEATRMGEVLVELGFLTPQDVVDALSIQVREKVIRCFQWPHFEYHFELLDAAPDAGLAYACPPVEALVLAGIRDHFDPSRIEPLFAAHAATRAKLLRSAEETALRFQATSAEQRLLREINGERTLTEVRDGCCLDAAQAAPLLAALIVTGALDLAVAATPARVAKPPAAASVSVPAQRTTARRPVPAPASPPVRPYPANAGSLSILRRELARSRKAPIAAPPPRPADERSARIEAERAFRQGIQMLEQSALGGAQKAFALACERSGDEPEYRMLEAWVQVLSVKKEEARNSARARTTMWARRVLERDCDSVRAQSILGQIATAAGDLDGAERHFRHALRVAPTDRDALRGARQVERRRSEQPAPPTFVPPEKPKKR